MGSDRLLAFVAGLLLPLFGCAQSPKLQLPDFDHLRAKAVSSVDLHVGAFPLWIAGHIIRNGDPEDAQVGELFSDLRGVHIRSYEFDADGQWSREDLEQVRRQLRAPEWQQIVQVRDRSDGSDVDIYIATDGQKINGLALIATEPREVTIVHMIGSIDVDKLARLRGNIQIGDVKINTSSTATVQ